MGIGDWGLGPIPNPQFHYKSERSLFFKKLLFEFMKYFIMFNSKWKMKKLN